MLYFLVLALVIAVVVFVANSKSRNKAEGLKEPYLKKYQSNEELFSNNAFLCLVFTQLTEGNQLSYKDINEAFEVMAVMEATEK